MRLATADDPFLDLGRVALIVSAGYCGDGLGYTRPSLGTHLDDNDEST